ncbi:NAD+ kinase [Kineococcus radiotolerans]|uniref:NAD kinase n=2 Tax=Kineococcus radiotolerans TaxID=131568 RepID=A6W7D7_KINRD|nr:NAD(+)/NADH kinase [Kineococcus radiotolerans]ABS02726.1 NAD(+) kinase [Kineococcus radiotolerans SRS30216 = ATCC BAA-149]MBB2900084.1 NAD+ kinase [Kineococcus radiotolerans]
MQPGTLGRLGLVVHPVRDTRAEAEIVIAWAGEHGKEVVGLRTDAARLPAGVRGVGEEEFARTVDAVVSLGGDGTMLGALRLVVGRGVPVLGVNLGHLGFLVELEPRELPAALERVAAMDFTVEPHLCLRTVLRTGDGLREAVAFNDIALARTPGRGTVTAALSVAGQRIGYLRCDAIVLATPTGSTAYSYAAGGPIVSPGADTLLVTPVAPMSGIGRPIVLGLEETVRLELMESSGPPVVEVDGIAAGELPPGSVVEVRAERDAGHVIRLDAADHGRRSRVKLSLLDLPLLPDEMLELVPKEMRRNESTWAR